MVLFIAAHRLLLPALLAAAAPLVAEGLRVGDAEAEEIGSTTADPVPSEADRRSAQRSLEWVGDLDPETLRGLMMSVGPEVYDESCTGHIAGVLTGRSGNETWWLDTVDGDPLVKGYMEEKNNAEMQGEWDRMFNNDNDKNRGIAASLWTMLRKWWQGIKNMWAKVKRWFKGSLLFGKGGEIQAFRKEVKRIKSGELDNDGKQSTVCSLDHSTLRLLPFSRSWHRDLKARDAEGKCDIDRAPNAKDRRTLGLMDPDRVIRATQMAVYQTCYHKCIRYVAQNFRKTAMGNGLPSSVTFCDIAFEHQQQRMKGENFERFLTDLLSNQESDVYMQCQALFQAPDAGPELIDFAIESICLKYPRPTPFYSPSENAPIELYNNASSFNTPVCKPGKDGTSAESVPARSCTEGTHCHCQKNVHADHASASQKSSRFSRLFGSWGATDHCTARRPAGADALIWVDTAMVLKSRWERTLSYLKKLRGRHCAGLGLILAGAALGAYASGAFTVVKAAAASSAGSTSGGILGLAGSISAGISKLSAAVVVANPTAVMMGASIVMALSGLYLLGYAYTFDCAKNMGCYPLKCEFDRSLNGGSGQCYMKPPKQGLTAHPLWWLPPPGMKCAYMGKKWYRNIGLGDAHCVLEACAAEDMAGGRLGYVKSPKSERNKLDLLNCQAMNFKDMSLKQQSEVLLTLRDDGRVNDAATKNGKQGVPECTLSGHCHEGLAADPFTLPFCHPEEHVCYEPLVTSLDVELSGGNQKNWKNELKQALSTVLFKNQAHTGERLIKILDQEDTSKITGTIVEPTPQEDTSKIAGTIVEPIPQDGTVNPDALLQHQAWAGPGREPSCQGTGGSCIRKRVQFVVKATKHEGLDTSRAKGILRSIVQHTVDSDELRLKKSLGKDFKMKIVTAGAMCVPHSRPEHSNHSCEENVNTGEGCSLACEQGWLPVANVWCDDGKWADELPEHQLTSPPPGFSLPPAFECKEKACLPKVFPKTCPRDVPGCFQWKDSGCSRGGLSGSKPICEVEAAEGYRLEDPASNKWRCESSGRWVVPPDAEDPKMVEGKCEMPSRTDAQDLGIVDYDSGIQSVCSKAVSGRTSGKAPLGHCEAKCKLGFRLRQQQRLRCMPDGQWAGKAACEPMTCDPHTLEEHHDMTTIRSFGCPESVQAGSQEGICHVECEDGFELKTNTLRCGVDGHFKGEAVCGADGQQRFENNPGDRRQGNEQKDSENFLYEDDDPLTQTTTKNPNGVPPGCGLHGLIVALAAAFLVI